MNGSGSDARVFHTAVETHMSIRTVIGVWSIPKMGLKFPSPALAVSVKRQVVRVLLEGAGASTGAAAGTGVGFAATGDAVAATGDGVAVTAVATTDVAATGEATMIGVARGHAHRKATSVVS